VGRAHNPAERNSMRVLFLWFPHRSPILMLSLLLFSPHLVMGQKTSPAGENPVELPDAPMPSTTVPESQPHFDFHRRDDRLPSRSEALPSQNTGTADSSGKKKYSMGGAPFQWSSPGSGQGNHGTAHGANAWDHVRRHIPFANSVILRTSRLTKTHPNVARIIKVLKPKL
jgi:hypothetical protein